MTADDSSNPGDLELIEPSPALDARVRALGHAVLHARHAQAAMPRSEAALSYALVGGYAVYAAVQTLHIFVR